MTYYHESLQTLVSLLRARDIQLDSIGVVRDGVGRLLVAAEKIEDPERLQSDIRAALGAYAAPLTIVTGDPARRLLETSPSDQRTLHVDGNLVSVRYYDRRIVGADWLSAPQEAAADQPPRLVFGSLKGGVGRSTAMAVLAADLASSGRRVLVVDLDIEAPGIGFMLLKQSESAELDQRPKYGTVDYLVEHGMNGVDDEKLVDFMGVSPFGRGRADVVPAVGRVTDELPHLMMEKLSRALVEDVRGDRRRVIDQVQDLINAFTRASEYDAVLIDARAGLGEISAAPLLGLGGEILLFANDQPQTFRGYRYLLAHMRQHLPMSDAGDWRQRLHFVQAKAPAAAAKRATFREKLYELSSEFLYDTEHLDEEGFVVPGAFNPAPDERGSAVPHDATYVEYHPNYDAFDPTDDASLLSSEVYRGPYEAFLNTAWALLGLDREEISSFD